MHNPEKHTHAHCLSFEKKPPNLTMMNTVDISGKKKRKRNKKNKKEEIRTNLLYKQLKIKEKMNKFALNAV